MKIVTNEECVLQVKRKEPQELDEGDELKRARPSTPPDEEDEGMFLMPF